VELKAPSVNPNYLFKWEPEKKFLFFITQGAHVSGTALKNLNEVQPEVIELLVEQVNRTKPTIGTVIDIDYVSKYSFIVSRKHYSSKHDLDLVKSALAKLNGIYKMSNEDFPTIVELVTREFPNIEIKTGSNWEDSKV
jgi:sigma54-dependent transcription regulator